MYDIACLLVKHLVVCVTVVQLFLLVCIRQANKRTDLLESFEFAIPVFHVYGHTSQCQVHNVACMLCCKLHACYP